MMKNMFGFLRSIAAFEDTPFIRSFGAFSVSSDIDNIGVLCSWWRSIDMDSALLHMKFKDGLSIRALKNRTTFYQKKGVQNHRVFQKPNIFKCQPSPTRFPSRKRPFVCLYLWWLWCVCPPRSGFSYPHFYRHKSKLSSPGRILKKPLPWIFAWIYVAELNLSQKWTLSANESQFFHLLTFHLVLPAPNRRQTPFLGLFIHRREQQTPEVRTWVSKHEISAWLQPKERLSWVSEHLAEEARRCRWYD